MTKRRDLTGLTFGKLKVIGPAEDYVQPNGRHRAQWWCECSCGNSVPFKVLGENLTTGHTQSCGCFQISQAIKSSEKRNEYNLTESYGIGYTVDSKKEFYFDLEDYEKIKDYCWSDYGTNYIQTQIKGKRVLFHQFVTDFKYPIIDHANRNGHDNRKENLRPASHTENMRNTTLSKNNKSGFTGVTFCKRTNKWQGQICCNRQHFAKQFKEKEEAVEWRLQKELELFGSDFAPQRHLFEQYGITQEDKPE